MQPAWQIELGKRWSEPHRQHHGLEHLREVLDALDLLTVDGWEFDLRLARRAAWFHDAVYDVNRDDNEERSADLARRLLPPEMAEPVARLVMVTKDHVVAPDDADGSALCDADLAVLGGSVDRYATYSAAIRVEYEHVPDRIYRTERARVLTSLLEHDPLYATLPGRTRWESVARRNVTAEIDSLGRF